MPQFMLYDGIFVMLLDCVGREIKWWLQVLSIKILILQICVSKTPRATDVCKLHDFIILLQCTNVVDVVDNTDVEMSIRFWRELTE